MKENQFFAVSQSIGGINNEIYVFDFLICWQMSLKLYTILGCTLLFIINSILTLKMLKTAASHESINPEELKKITNKGKGHTNDEVDTDNECTNEKETESIKLKDNVQANREIIKVEEE